MWACCMGGNTWMRKVNIEPSWRNSDEHLACKLSGLKCVVSESLSPDAIGLGSVEYCRRGNNWPACDPYPDWLPFGRGIYRRDAPKKPLFYKPTDIPKRFVSCVMDEPPDGQWVASEVIKFKDEWRAYIIDGEVYSTYCYSNFENELNLRFPWEVPAGLTAAVDFGTLDDGRILPVELNDPYAIGWYGNLTKAWIYSKFLVAGWEYMLKRHGY